MNYGIIFEEEVNKYASKICNCLGYGINHTAHKLIVETATAESGLGKFKDSTLNAGMGICQFDKLPFEDTKIRNMHLRDRILNELGVDISLVEWEHLRYNTFLSLLFCRLFYRLRLEAVPSSLENRAKYWKKYYNTFKGKGSVEHYVEMNK